MSLLRHLLKNLSLQKLPLHKIRLDYTMEDIQNLDYLQMCYNLINRKERYHANNTWKKIVQLRLHYPGIYTRRNVSESNGKNSEITLNWVDE